MPRLPAGVLEDRRRTARLYAESRRSENKRPAGQLPVRRYFVVDRELHWLSGPHGCVSEAAARWTPGEDYLRVRVGDSDFVLLTGAERLEAERVVEARAEEAA